jgi:hypothetical protein
MPSPQPVPQPLPDSRPPNRKGPALRGRQHDHASFSLRPRFALGSLPGKRAVAGVTDGGIGRRSGAARVLRSPSSSLSLAGAFGSSDSASSVARASDSACGVAL